MEGFKGVLSICLKFYDIFYLKTLRKKIFLLPLQSVSNEAKKDFNTMAKKGNRIQVILECTEHKESGLPGMSRYITTKNRKNTTARIELKKYNSVLKKVTLHKEIK